MGSDPHSGDEKGATGVLALARPSPRTTPPQEPNARGRRAGRLVPPGAASVYQSIRTPMRVVNGARMALGFW